LNLRTLEPANPVRLRLTLVRHGETEGQSSVRYHGRTDVSLSAVGRQQMGRVRRALQDRVFAGVYASTLSRSVEAAVIASGAGTVQRIAGFDEIDFGDWEGLTAEEIAVRDPELHARWQAHAGDFRYPGGESVAEFRARVARALRQVLNDARQGEFLFVVHKGVIRCVLAELLRLREEQRAGVTAALGSIHVVARAHGVWTAEMLDRTDHL
jgi:broad specificity phosphatase PhoE